MIDALLQGLFLVVQWPAIGYLLLGVACGLVIGVVPGLGGGIGILLGQRWVSRVSERRLRQGFAALLLVSAISTGLEALQPQRPSTEAGLRISTRWPEA